MRKALINYLLKTDHKNRYFLTADVGFNTLEPLQEKMGSRFINVGIAEQSMIGIASGLELSGKEVWTYSMCAFYLGTIEFIRNAILYQGCKKIVMVGVGYGYDYEELGNTHFAFEDNDIIGRLAGIRTATPFDANGVERFLKSWKFEKPLYLRLSRFDRDNYGFQDHDNNDRYPKECGKLNYFINKYGTGFEEKRGE